mgnify:CR=1 FL=1
MSTWQVHAFDLEALAADFPYARSLIAVRSQRTHKKSGESSEESRYYLSSREPGEHTAAQWLGLIRGHWAGGRFHFPMTVSRVSGEFRIVR